MKAKNPEILERPNIYDYHNYRDFLKEHCLFMRSQDKGLSLRKICLKARLSPSYLSLVINKKRSMSEKALKALLGPLGINARDGVFLGYLRDLEEADNQEDRNLAYKRIRRFSMYKSRNANNLDMHKILSAWYYFAIRELSAFPDFQMDEKWIQKQLNFDVSLTEIRECVHFLLKYKFIVQGPDGKLSHPEKQIVCDGGIYRLGQSEFHKQVLELAADSIYSVPRNKRSLTTHTVAVPQEKFDEIKGILDEALEKVQKINENHTESDPDSVYQVSFLAFPVAQKRKSEVES